MKATKYLLSLIGVAAFTYTGSAAPSVVINGVRQRYPWNNMVDITYTVSGYNAATDKGGYACQFRATVGGVSDINAGGVWIEGDGTFTQTWDATGVGQVVENSCKMTAKLFDLTVIKPATSTTDGDYEIWDLVGKTNYYENVIVYDGAPNQSLSDLRYNTDEYKTTKLVLRKIAASDTKYNVGANYADHKNCGATEAQLNRHPLRENAVNVDQAYFIGVFQLTRAQYRLITGDTTKYGATGNDLLPANSISYNALRGGSNANAANDATEDSVLGLANKLFETSLTAVNGQFELPTDAQWEIAAKAGTNSMWFFTDDDAEAVDKVSTYAQCVYNNNSGVRAVGLLAASPNGLFDIYGNVWEWCRDVYTDAAGDATKDFQASVTSDYKSGTGDRVVRGGYYSNAAGYCSSSYRGYNGAAYEGANAGVRLCRVSK